MRVKSLLIKNFRNIKDIYIPEEKINTLNIFTGDNGQGKTNILEAIYVLSGNNSFRSSNYEHLVNYDSESFNIRARYVIQEKDMEISLSYHRNKTREMLINKKKALRKNPYIPKVVLFVPDDLYLVKGSPGKRRHFLDFILKQISEEYAYLIEEYGKILKRRNLILKNKPGDNKTLDIINGIFIEKSCRIIMQRINFVNLLEKEVKDIFFKLNREPSDIKIKYALSFPIHDDKINLAVLRERMNEEMTRIKEQEFTRKNTLIGPHLDDLNFYYDNKLARFFASQGQQRNLVIALKIAEMQTFYRIKGFYPLFLLDEVLSELDYDKRNLLIKYLSEANFQTFMTAVNIDDIDAEKSAVFHVENGSVL